MRKGIAPIMATILIVLITVFMAGGLMVYLRSSQGQISDQTTEQLSEFSEAISYKYSIISPFSCKNPAGSDFIVLRNDGERNISSSGISILRNGDPLTSTITWTSPSSGCSINATSETCLLKGVFSQDLSSGDTITVLIGEGAESKVCV